MTPKAHLPTVSITYACVLSQYRILWFWVYYIYDQVFLNGQTLCLNKVIISWTFAKNGQKTSDIWP